MIMASALVKAGIHVTRRCLSCGTRARKVPGRDSALAGRRAFMACRDGTTGPAKSPCPTWSQGAVDQKTTEVIALAIAVNKECDGCTGRRRPGSASAGDALAQHVLLDLARGGLRQLPVQESLRHLEAGQAGPDERGELRVVDLGARAQGHAGDGDLA